MWHYVYNSQDFDKAIELDPKNAEAYYKRGNSKYRLGKDEEAIKDYDKAIELNPQYAEAYYYRGHAKFLFGKILGEKEDAIEDYKRIHGIQSSKC